MESSFVKKTKEIPNRTDMLYESKKSQFYQVGSKPSLKATFLSYLQAH